MTAANANPVLANAQQRYEVHRSDLPLSCPLPSMGLWNSHPRVYMAIETQGGESDCPYCGAHFVLVRSEEHTSELQSLMRISYAVFCLKKTTTTKTIQN